MTPSFCFIAPTAYLEFTLASTSHLVLAHLVDTDEQYANFYANIRTVQPNAFVMMDCSAYELKEPYAPEKLLDLGKKCNADAIVLPDYPFQPGSKTIQAAEEMIPVFKNADFKTFFVPQSQAGDLDDWLHCYEWAAANPGVDVIGMSILGIPNALTWCDPSYARVVMSQMLLDRKIFNHNKHHHYLGLNTGPGLEIPSLIRLGVMDTIDSSGPIWAGILGHSYTREADSLQQVKKIKLPVDFSLKMTKDSATLARITHNIELTNQLFSNNEEEVWYANE